MENIKTNTLYFRAENVLESCTNLDQLRNALNYSELYFKLTKDKSGYDILIRKYNKLTEKLNLDEETKNN